MKQIKSILLMLLCIGLLISTQSCMVMYKKDNGRHIGWYNNHNNPHSLNSSKPLKNKAFKFKAIHTVKKQLKSKDQKRINN